MSSAIARSQPGRGSAFGSRNKRVDRVCRIYAAKPSLRLLRRHKNGNKISPFSKSYIEVKIHFIRDVHVRIVEM